MHIIVTGYASYSYLPHLTNALSGQNERLHLLVGLFVYITLLEIDLNVLIIAIYFLNLIYSKHLK